jgi:hypothetical protein
MTYAVNGKQYVSIMAGNSMFTFGLREPAAPAPASAPAPARPLSAASRAAFRAALRSRALRAADSRLRRRTMSSRSDSTQRFISLVVAERAHPANGPAPDEGQRVRRGLRRVQPLHRFDLLHETRRARDIQSVRTHERLHERLHDRGGRT